MILLNYLKDIVNAIIKLDQKLGFRSLFRYVLLILFVYAIFNIKTVVKGCIELISDIQDEIHTEKMERRDQLLAELVPLLAEFRGELGADRILYFEYHNSKENLVGIPFKYIDLVLQSTRYGIYPVDETRLKEINAGSITDLYEVIKYGETEYCYGPNDLEFQSRYPGAFSIMESANIGTNVQLFISIPGVKQPLGLVVVEWMKTEVDIESTRKIYRAYIPRIGGLILSKR